MAENEIALDGVKPLVEKCQNCDCAVVKNNTLYCRRLPPSSTVVALRQATDKMTPLGKQSQYHLQDVPARPSVLADDWCWEWKPLGSRNHAR